MAKPGQTVVCRVCAYHSKSRGSRSMLPLAETGKRRLFSRRTRSNSSLSSGVITSFGSCAIYGISSRFPNGMRRSKSWVLITDKPLRTEVLGVCALSFQLWRIRRIVSFACANDRDDLPAWSGNDRAVKVICLGRTNLEFLGIHNVLGSADNVPDPCATVPKPSDKRSDKASFPCQTGPVDPRSRGTKLKLCESRLECPCRV